MNTSQPKERAWALMSSHFIQTETVAESPLAVWNTFYANYGGRNETLPAFVRRVKKLGYHVVPVWIIKMDDSDTQYYKRRDRRSKLCKIKGIPEPGCEKA